MYFSHLHMRLAGVLLSTGTLAFFGVLAGTAHADDNYYCSPGSTTQYDGPSSGTWGNSNSDTSGDNTTYWSGGLPDDNCQAVIPSGDTVTLTTTPCQEEACTAAGASAEGLTIDGGATLIVEGVSSQGEQGNTSNITTLMFGAYGLTIDKGATLDIEATGNASPFTGDASGETPGGSAQVINDQGTGNEPITNLGTINASSNDGSYGETLQWNGDLTNSGALSVASGTLHIVGANYPMIVDNTGTFDVASGATMAMSAGDGSSFTNPGGGIYTNSGTTTLTSSMYWIQSGGSESGNPIQLTGGEVLQDSAGTGAFEYDDPCGGGDVTGTIAAGQTLSVVGTTGGCSGNVGNAPTMYIGSNSSQANVVNDGTIVLDADGSGTSSGGYAVLEGTPTLENYGTIESTVTDSSYNNQLLAPLVNESGGTVNLTGGELYQTAGTPTTNSGTANIGPGATWLVQGGSFTNSGTLGVQIAGANNFGSFNLTAGSKFTAGGTLSPTLTGGYAPAKGTEFPIIHENGGGPSGKFGSVTGGFSADYSKETASSNPYLGVVYGGAASTAVIKPTIKKVSGGAGKMELKLSCDKGSKSACSYSFTGTVGKTKVASGKGTVKAGKTVTVALKLNKAGTKLLKTKHRLKVKLVIKAGSKTLKTSTVTVTKAAAKKKKK